MADDDSWVFDSLVQFLRGPVWNIPIFTFIENKSVIFESGIEPTEEHEQVHEEYKNLVDFMLGSYMEDMEINPEQFEQACNEASNSEIKIHKNIFEQVWAANDFSIFNPMMIRKNLELQLQVLELLRRRYGEIPDSFTEGNEEDGEGQDDEDGIIEKVKALSLEDDDDLDDDTRALERAIVDSKAERDRLEAEHEIEEFNLEKAIKLSLNNEAEPAAVAPSAPPVQADSDVDPEEVERRRQYLKEQRDKLLAMKQQEREKRLQEFEQMSGSGRPKSSMAARKALTGAQIDPQTLELRRTLAERLKAEVINKEDS